MRSLISVIVPIYNTDKYLDKCIKSILSQTYEQIELILINDGSTDNSGKICDNYASVDTRVRVVHKKNGGISDARNTGLNFAKGDLISFVDSDDFIHPSMLSRLWQSLINCDADIAACDRQIIYNYENELVRETLHGNKANNEIKVLNNIEAIEMIFFDPSIKIAAVWGKLYKKSLFDGIHYPVGRTYEDTATTYKILYNASKITFTYDKLYFYLKRTDSISGREVNHATLDLLDAVKERSDFFLAKGLIDLYHMSSYDYLIRIINLHNRFMNLKTCDNWILSELRQRYVLAFKNFRNFRHLNSKQKIKLYSHYISPNLHVKCSRLKSMINLRSNRSNPE